MAMPLRRLFHQQYDPNAPTRVGAELGPLVRAAQVPIDDLHQTDTIAPPPRAMERMDPVTGYLLKVRKRAANAANHRQTDQVAALDERFQEPPNSCSWPLGGSRSS
jgi:hypothetical protein